MKYIYSSSLHIGIYCFCAALLSLSTYAAPQSDLITAYNPDGTIEIVHTYTLNKQELEAIQAIAQYPGQTRDAIYLDARLTILSRIKLDDCRNRDYWAHYDPEGKLIGDYITEPIRPNNGENMGTGSDGQNAAYSWYYSVAHRQGMLDLYNGDTNYMGIAAIKDPNIPESLHYDYYWFCNQFSIFKAGALQNPEVADQYTLYFPDGIHRVNPDFDWISSIVAGMPKVYINADMSYTSNWMGTFTELGGNFFKSPAIGMFYAAGDGYFWVKNQGWLYASEDTIPYFWAAKRHNWISVGRQAVYDYNNHLNEDWTPDGEYSYLTSDKWQTFVGEGVVIAWQCDTLSERNVTVRLPNGELLAHNPHAAYLWIPEAPGSYTFTLSRGNTSQNGESVEEVVASQTVIVLAQPGPNAVVDIVASNTEVNINEPYTVTWSASEGVPIVRLSPGLNPNHPDGVYSNQNNGSITFSHTTPGTYTHTIQLGSVVKSVAIHVIGTLSTPAQSGN